MSNSEVLSGCEDGTVCGYCGALLDSGGDFCRETGDTHTLAVCRNALARQLRDARRIVAVCFDCLRAVPEHATWCPQGRRAAAAPPRSSVCRHGVDLAVWSVCFVCYAEAHP